MSETMDPKTTLLESLLSLFYWLVVGQIGDRQLGFLDHCFLIYKAGIIMTVTAMTPQHVVIFKDYKYTSQCLIHGGQLIELSLSCDRQHQSKPSVSVQQVSESPGGAPSRETFPNSTQHFLNRCGLYLWIYTFYKLSKRLKRGESMILRKGEKHSETKGMEAIPRWSCLIDRERWESHSSLIQSGRELKHCLILKQQQLQTPDV